ncbi:C-type isolectin Sp-CL4-like [Antennarius striatus]|uniref:C-type isolectin Sp-CL4-like n=1 Tax=Antennarius striatus TaxID=241820 RepID=UPI0035B291B7
MHPAVGVAVLLLVCCLDTVRAGYESGICDRPQPCENGWSRIDTDRCAKYIKDLQTFSGAEDHCHSLGSELVSIHTAKEMFNVLCLTFIPFTPPDTIWIGAKFSRKQGLFTWIDGSEFSYTFWHEGEPNNVNGMEECIEMNFGRWGKWNDTKCSKNNYFVCAKKM